MRKIGFLIVSAAFCHGALAEVTYRADLGVGYSDNIRRVDVDPTDETIGVVGLELSWLAKTVRLDADVKVGGDYMHYVDDTFDNEYVGLAGGAITIGIAPEHCPWLCEDSFGQAQSDPFAMQPGVIYQHPNRPELRLAIQVSGTQVIAILEIEAKDWGFDLQQFPSGEWTQLQNENGFHPVTLLVELPTAVHAAWCFDSA